MTEGSGWKPGKSAGRIASSFPIRQPAGFPTFRRDTITDEVSDVTGQDLVGAVALVLSRHNDNAPVRVGVTAGQLDRIIPVDLRPDPLATISEYRTQVTTLLGAAGIAAPAGVVVGQSRGASGVQPVDGRFALRADRIDLDYSTDFYDSTMAASLLDQVIQAATALSGSAVPLVRDLDVLSEKERARILARDRRPPLPDPADPWDMIRDSAQSTPDKIAIVDADGELTYRELMYLVSAAGDSMASAGLGAGDVVTVPVEPDRWTVVAMLAALRSGACYVPIDQHMPAARQRAILDQVRPSAEVVRRGSQVVAIPVAAATTDPVIPAGKGSGLDRPCYVLFTSGSTGVPKGVAISRRGLASLLASTEVLMDRTADEVWASIHSFSFDASVWEIYGSLCYGATLVIASAEERRDPDDLVTLMRRHGVTSLTVSPTAFEGVRHAVAEWPAVVSRLSRVILCAEPLSVPAVESWFDRWGDEQPALLNMYGITECTVHSTVERLRRSVGENRIRIGAGLPDTPIFVVDQQLRLVPDGVAGEMLVGGDGVALGYVGSDRAVFDERFVPDPFCTNPASRLYRSGDIARRLADGTLEYLGRRDRQLKIRGYRIEAADVETAALRHPEVDAARVWVQPGEEGAARLCLCVRAPAGQTDHGSVAVHLAGLLPGYMLPTLIVVVATFPVTANGKLDTAALLHRYRQDVMGATRATEPSSAIARNIARAMATVLAIDDLSPDANFFRVGGDSISAVRLVGALRDDGIEVSLVDVYRHRTAVALADVAGTPRALPVPVPGPVRLQATPLQQAMIYHNLVDGPEYYHDVLHYLVDVVLDDRLRPALDAVTARHPALRSAFASAPGGGLEQRIATTAQLELTFHNIQKADGGDLDQRLREWCARERTRGFDVAAGGLVRVAVHRVDDDASVLSVSVHHAVLDGWSASLFVTELLATWVGRGRGTGPASQDEAVLREYQRLVEQAARDPQTRKFWAQRLAELGPPALPDRGVSMGGPSRILRLPLTEATCTTFDRWARELGVSPRSVFTAVHHAAAAAAVTSTPISGLVSGGRPEVSGGAEAMGLFLNTLPARLELGGLSWREAIRRTFDDETATAPYRRFPVADLHAMAGRRVVDIAFNYTHFRSYSELEPSGVSVLRAWYDEQTEFPLLVTVNRAIGRSGAELTLVARANLEDELEHRYADAFSALCGSLSTSLDTRVGGAARPPDPVTELRGARRLIDWAALLAAIRDRARQQPDTVAVLDGADRRTYAQLWTEANELAARLAETGVGPRSRVVIECCRGIGMVTTVLATWLRGASTVPIDADLPPRRQELLITLAVPAAKATVSGTVVTVTPHGAAGSSPAPRDTGSFDPQDEAYLLFTSGTTGAPKGVAMPFEALANLTAWQVRRFGPDGCGRVALFAAVGFDVSLQETLACLVGGGTLVVVPAPTKMDPQATLQLLRRQSVDVLFTPPLVLRQLARAWRALGEAPALRWIIAAGEQLVVDDQLRAFATAVGFRLTNQYGPTETHVVTEKDLGTNPEQWPEAPGIGLPIDNVTVHVEPTLRSAGPPGELLVSGPAVALGYIDPGTGQTLATDGFEVTDGTRTYRTGDLVRLRADGIDFHSRLDALVKISGYRVDVVEVERTLRAAEAVADCVVHVARGDRGVQLRAVVQPEANAVLDEQTLRAHLGERLPSYAIPAVVEIVPALAADSRGKTSRAAPARPIRRRSAAGRSPLERTVLVAWSDVLGRRQTDVDVTFFAAGGSSLLLLDLFLKLRASIAAPFALRHLIQYPTVSAFTGFVRLLNSSGGTAIDIDTTVH